MVDDTWFSRDLLVLKAAVSAFDDLAPEQIPQGMEIVEATGLDVRDVTKALIALDGEYLDVRKTAGGGSEWDIYGVFANARRAAGAWPDPHRLAEQVIDAIDAVADDASEPESKSRLRRAAASVGGMTRDVAVKVAAEALTRGMGM